MQKRLFNTPFFGFVAIIALANLLLFNDWILWMPFGEFEVINDLDSSVPSWWPVFLQNLINDAAFKPFLVRLPSVLFMLFAFWGIYTIGKPLFGLKRIQNALLVLSVSWMMLPLGKLASGDMALFFGMSLALFTGLRFLKTEENKWRNLHLAFLLFSCWVHPWMTAIGIFSFDLFVYLRHPTGKLVLRLWHWAVLPVIIVCCYLIGGFPYPDEWFYADVFNLGFLKYITWNLIGVLPFWGFLVAGLWQAFKNSLKGEEWAILILAFFLGGLFFGPLLQLAFALAIARALTDFTHPKYPYKKLIRGFAIIGLLTVFCLGAVGMLNGFYLLQGPGFRAGMAICIGFWIPYFFGVLGLWSLSEGQFRNMAVLAGGISFFFLLVQFLPLYEGFRHWKSDVPKKVAGLGYTELYVADPIDDPVLEFYLKENKVSQVFVKTPQSPFLVDSSSFSTYNLDQWEKIDTFPSLETHWYLVFEKNN